MFDPRRQVILLLGGDKSGEWSEWYHWAVPAADDLYEVGAGWMPAAPLPLTGSSPS